MNESDKHAFKPFSKHFSLVGIAIPWEMGVQQEGYSTEPKNIKVKSVQSLT